MYALSAMHDLGNDRLDYSLDIWVINRSGTVVFGHSVKLGQTNGAYLFHRHRSFIAYAGLKLVNLRIL